MKKLLLISPYFPPMTELGAKRALNIVQYLPKHNWEIIVLASVSFHNNPDESLLVHLNKNLIVYRQFVSPIRKLIKLFGKKNKSQVKKEIKSKPILPKQSMSITPFDQYLWDVPSAIRAGKVIINKHKPDIILVNADPWSGLLVGNVLHKWSGIPWVPDFRDPWSAFKEKMELRPKWSANLIRKYEKKFFSTAARVILNTRNARDIYRELYKDDFDENHFTFIRNAFNSNILGTPEPQSGNRDFTICYFGTFRDFVSPEYILKGFKRFLEKYDEKLKTISKLVLYANRNNILNYYLNETNLGDNVEIHSHVSLNLTTQILSNHSVLALVAGPGYRYQIPAKLYDYLALGKPILALSDNDEINEIINASGCGRIAGYDNIEEIADQLYDLYQNHKNMTASKNFIAKFDAEKQALSFNQLLRSVLDQN